MLRHMREHVKIIMAVVILLFVVSCFAGYGLYSRSGSGDDGMRDYPVAEVDGSEIMRSTVENGAVRVAEQFSGGQQITSDDMLFYRRAALDSVIIQAEVEKEIKTRKIEVTKDDVDAAYVKIMDSYPTREEFKAFLDRTGTSEADVKKELRQQLSQQKLVESIAADVQVSDAEAFDFYNTAKEFIFKDKDGKVRSYNEVSADVKSAIQMQKSQEKQNEFYGSLLERAKVKILDPTIFPVEKAPVSADVTESPDKTVQ